MPSPITLMKPPTRHGMYYTRVDGSSGPRYKLLPGKRLRSNALNMRQHGINTLFVAVPAW